MVKTERVIGFYTDIYNNEINEYEEIERYEVRWKGKFFEDDSDQWNYLHVDNFYKAMELFNLLKNETEVTLHDYECGMDYDGEDWF